MPGHAKIGVGGEPDPDPLPFLVVSNEIRRKDLSKMYDPKRSVWAQDGKGGYVEGLKEYEDADKVTVLLGHEKKHFKPEQVAPVNPPKFEKCEDMANLTFLNEASVFWNLKSRYLAKLIYTYSGLFCVVINPYRRYPIYTEKVVKMYQGKRRNECPPHLWAITELAYRNMMDDKRDQSMLITGESGAGKTENTKKVISYLALVATKGKKVEKKVSLEDQIVATNPILESYGNAKTSKNDNSSRFGKFIRIHFNYVGKLAGCDIKAYLFEKSRITKQQQVERSYHIFYQLFQSAVPDLKAKCLLTDSIYDYSYVCKGRTKVDSINDNEELQFTDNAFDIIGFSAEEKWDCYKLTAAVMTMGELRFKQKGRDEQCEPDKFDISVKVGKLCGVDPESIMTAFTKPKIKVGTEWVNKGQNVEQATNAVGGIARSIYHRTFLWLIEKCNETLIDQNVKKSNFCAVLDIAGFEIFTYNGYEQLSINFVNEKLQQFFNHHMFVVEQEEYIAEGIDWQMVDFGMDLADCIITFEKPMGIWAVLEEESMFPKATDKTFEDKLKSSLMGKCPTFAKPQSKTDKDAHFAIIHYAGTVSYNVTSWLEKNKDPLNETVVDVLKGSSNKLMVHLWKDYPSQSMNSTDDKSKKKKGSGCKTVSSVFLIDLTALMTTLNNTDPHFVRCIVPNACKHPGGVDPPLIMHQLTCNGVLEGIRICMRGFPNRIPYSDFQKRYSILIQNEQSISEDQTAGAMNIVATLPELEKKTKFGKTKVFFRSGALAVLEESRDEILDGLITKLQGCVLGFQSRKLFIFKTMQRAVLPLIQRCLRKYLIFKKWPWYRLIQYTIPLTYQIQMEEIIEDLQIKNMKVISDIEEREMEISESKQAVILLDKEVDIMKIELNEKHIQIEELQYNEADIKQAITKSNDQIKAKEYELMEMETLCEEIGEESSIIVDKIEHSTEVLKELNTSSEMLSKKIELKDQEIKYLNADISVNDISLTEAKKQKEDFNKQLQKSLKDKVDVEERLSMSQRFLRDKKDIEQELLQQVEILKKEREILDHEKKETENLVRVNQMVLIDTQKEVEDLKVNSESLENQIRQKNADLQSQDYIRQKLHTKVRDLSSHATKLEQELDTLKQSKLNKELSASDLNRNLANLNDQYEAAFENLECQKQMRAKMESRAMEFRRELEENKIYQESTFQNLKKKHADAVQDISNQIESLQSLKSKIVSNCNSISREVQKTNNMNEKVVSDLHQSKTHLSALKENLTKAERKVSEQSEEIKRFNNHNSKVSAENNEKIVKLQYLKETIQQSLQEKNRLQNQLDKMINFHETDEQENNCLKSKIRSVEDELHGYRYQLSTEEMEKKNARLCLDKAVSSINQWELNYKNNITEKVEEIEQTNLKLQARLSENESTLNALDNKLTSLESLKADLSRRLSSLSSTKEGEIEKLNQEEKRCKSGENSTNALKARAGVISQELNKSQADCRALSSELFTLKNGTEDLTAKLEEAKCNRKKLTSEIKDYEATIKSEEQKIHLIEKQRLGILKENEYLTEALEDIERSLIVTEDKQKELKTDMNNIKKVNDKAIQDMEDSFEKTKENQKKVMNEVQLRLEEESKLKTSLLSESSSLKHNIDELETALENESGKKRDLDDRIKTQIKFLDEIDIKFKVEQNMKEDAKMKQLDVERKLRVVTNSLEEFRANLDHTDKIRRQLEQEKFDTNETLSDQENNNTLLQNIIQSMKLDINNLLSEKIELEEDLKNAENQADNKMLEAVKLTENLRYEQERSQALEHEVKDIEARAQKKQMEICEAESDALRHGEKVQTKLKGTIHELENDVEAEKAKQATIKRNLKKNSRDSAAVQIKIDQGKNNEIKIKELIDKLQQQIISYKKQVEEAEEIAAINLCKYQRIQQLLGPEQERENKAREVLALIRSKRGQSSGI